METTIGNDVRVEEYSAEKHTVRKSKGQIDILYVVIVMSSIDLIACMHTRL